MPQDCAVVAVVRNEHVIVPRDETPLIAGDELLCIAAAEAEAAIEELLSGRPPGNDRSSPDGSSPNWSADRRPELPELSSDGV
jgi:NhaP-type Na+/H+ and K+/H+ antiporter